MADYIPHSNELTIRKLLSSAKKKNPSVKFLIYDTEGIVIKSSNPDEIVLALDGGDEMATIECKENNRTLGSFLLQPYEQEDILCDHTDNAFCNKVARAVQC